MAPSKKSIAHAAVVAPKEKRKVAEAAEPAGCRVDPSNVLVKDCRDSHSSSTTQRRMMAAEPEPKLNSEQLIQMLSELWK